MLSLGLPCAQHLSAARIAAHADHLHALTGQIWDASATRFISVDDFYQRLRRADFVLLGETHTNPDHHRLQRKVIERMVAAGRRPAVVFEMFERDNQPAIDRVRSRFPHAADRIARETNMRKRGWSWRLYKPLVETVLDNELPLFGADLSQPQVREIVMQGLKALDADLRKSLALDEPLAPSVIATMRADIVAAHCGHAPEQMLDGMVAAQRARDAMLAYGLTEHADRDGAVLIAGSGHVRNDSGAPAYLRRSAPHETIISVTFTEVDQNKPNPQDYASPASTTRPIYDYLWFTRGHESRDTCARFEKRLRGLDRAAPPE